MPLFSAEKLREITTKIFEAAGAPHEHASKVAEHLVESNLVGHDSHGVVRILRYVNLIKEGKVKPAVIPEIILDKSIIAVIDGRWGFGVVAADMAMELAVEKAKKNNVGMVGLHNCNHIGRVGSYAQQAAREDMVGFVACNSSPGIVAPYGGIKRRLGANALALAIPTGEAHPFLMDFASSVVAEGKIRIKYHEHEKLPQGWIIDEEGKPSTNPLDFYGENDSLPGALLPFGGHKGYAIALAIDLLCGALVGGRCTTGLNQHIGNGVLMIAIDVESFTQLDAYTQQVQQTLSLLRSTPPAEGFERVMIPGEPEFSVREKRLKEGIVISEEIWNELKNTATGLGVEKLN